MASKQGALTPPLKKRRGKVTAKESADKNSRNFGRKGLTPLGSGKSKTGSTLTGRKKRT